MLDLALGLGVDPTQRIRYYNRKTKRHLLFTPLVVLYNEHSHYGFHKRWRAMADRLVLHLLKEDTQVDNSTLLWIIRVGCHSIAENVIRSQHQRAINFSIAVSELEGGSVSFGRYIRVTPLLVACSDTKPSAEKLSLIHCLLERNARADLEAMIAAAEICDEQLISLLQRHGSPVNGFIPNLGSPLSSACTTFIRFPYTDSTAIPLLLKLGASPNSPENKDTSTNHPQKMDLASWELSPLHLLAVAEERPSVVEALDLLLEHGADINHRAWLDGFKGLKQSITGLMMHDLDSPGTALEYAIMNSRWGTATRLLSENCELTGREVLLIASNNNPRDSPEGREVFRQFVSTLLAKAPSQAAALHWNGVTVLQTAIESEHTDLILALLTFGVIPTVSDFLCMLCNRTIKRAKVCSLPTSIQMQLAIDVRFCDTPSAVRLILAFACPKVVRHALDSGSGIYDSEGLCYMIARIASEDKTSYFFDWEFGDRRRDQQADSLTIDDLVKFISRRTIQDRTEDWECTAVTMAARAGRVDILRILLDSGREEWRSSGLIPLFLLKEILICNTDTLLPSGTDINESNWGRLGMWISYCGMDDPNMKCSPLTAAAMVKPENVSEEVMHLLLELKYQPDGWTVLIASCQGHLSILQRLQRLECWPHILSHEDRPDWCPTALQAAVYSANIDIVRFLVNSAATIDTIDSSPCRPFCFVPPGEVTIDQVGIILPRTALQHAVEKEDMQLVTLLVNAGANVNAPAAWDSGATTLQIASIQGSILMVQYLISKGADLYAAGAVKHGRMALHGAAEHGRKDVVELILACGTPAVHDRREHLVKAIFYAEKNAQHVVASILHEAIHPPWGSKDDEALAMFSDDLESSAEHSALNELRGQLESWSDIPLEDKPYFRAHGSNPDSEIWTRESYIDNATVLEADNPCFFHDLELGLEGHGELDISGISDMNIYEGGLPSWLTFQEDSGAWAQGSSTALEADNYWLVHDVEPGFAGHEELEVSGISEMNLDESGVEWWPTFQEDIAAWVEGQPSFEGHGVDDMLLDDLFSTGYNPS